MFERRTLKVLAVVLSAFAALILLSFVWREPPVSIAVSLLMLLPLYFFPVLQDTRSCWLWCGPSAIGWIGVAAFWLLASWLLAWGIAHARHLYVQHRGTTASSPQDE